MSHGPPGDPPFEEAQDEELTLEAIGEASAPGLVAVAVDVLSSQWRAYIGASATMLVPVNLLESYLLRDVPVPAPGRSPEELSEFAAVSAVFSLAVLFVILPLLSGGISRAMAAERVGGRTTLDEVYRVGGRWLFAVLGTLFIVALTVGLGFVALIIPGVYASVRLYAAVPAVVVEGAGVFDAIRRSWELTSGRFWHVLGVVLLTALLVFGLTFVVDLTVTMFGLGDGPWVLTGLLNGLVSSVVMPFGIGVVVLVYLAQRVRTEGLDEGGLAADLARSERA